MKAPELSKSSISSALTLYLNLVSRTLSPRMAIAL
jgi:hypothetical protein